MEIIVVEQDGKLCSYKMELIVHMQTLINWKGTLAMPKKVRSGIIFKSTSDLEENITDSPLWVFQSRIQNFQSEAAQAHFWRA